METVDCKLSTSEFSVRLRDSLVHYYIIHMKDSFMVWIGCQPPKFTNLAVAMNTRFVSILPGSAIFLSSARDSCRVAIGSTDYISIFN